MTSRRTYMATPIVLILTIAVVADVDTDTLTLYDDPAAFQAALTTLGLSAEVLDFERLPDGTPIGAGDLLVPSPLVYNIFGGSNTATFTTASAFVFENFVSISPNHSLREEERTPIELAFASPVAAVGVYALEIDNFATDAASAVYRTTILPDMTQWFDNSGGSKNESTFLGAIATNDAGTSALPILTSVQYNQAGIDLTYLDDLSIAVPEPLTLSLLVFGAGGMMHRGWRRRRLP